MLFRSSATVAAAGTVQANATLVTADNNYVNSGTGGVILPVPVVGREISITNSTAASINLFPSTGVSLENSSVNVGVAIPAYATVAVVAKSTSNWWFQTPVYNAGNGMIITQAANGTVSWSIGQAVGTGNSPTFNGLNVTTANATTLNVASIVGGNVANAISTSTANNVGY